MTQLDTFTTAYIEAALWSSTAYGSPEEQAEDPNHEGRFDRTFQSCGYDAFTPDTHARIINDCAEFQADNAALLEQWYSNASETPERAGHDFWLTRNRHGAGFWDRWDGATDQGKIGKALTDAAHAYGDVDLFWTEAGIAAA